MLRSIGAGVAGLVIAILLVWLIELIGHAVYPPPVDIDFSDSEAVRTYIAALPVAAVLFVGVAWVIGTFVGISVACRIGRAGPVIYAVLVGGFVLAGAITMLIIIPHPWWFTVVSLPAIIATAYAAMRLAPRSVDQVRSTT